ncbi:MAG: 23S rRNA (guanosine(2251)-2'-O)-methyltransferase RlmB [Alphaproteobacteria bacterium]|nr:23S rRNA (guanosine(2251)-2'-O)-methyltransferase RlmB [Alphaproteobacteria bacterium]
MSFRPKHERKAKPQDKRNAPKKQGEGSSWLIGRHAVEAVLAKGKRDVIELLSTDQQEGWIKQYGYRPAILKKQEFDNKFEGRPHQGVAARVAPLPEMFVEDVLESDVLLILDQVTDPHNLGACLRSADAFGCGGVLVPSYNSAGISDVVAKAASGALETVPLVQAGNMNRAIEKLQKAGFWVIGLAGEATEPLSAKRLTGKIALVMGSEGEGIRDLVAKNCDDLAKIPMSGSVESLNVSVSSGVALYEVQRQRKFSKK